MLEIRLETCLGWPGLLRSLQLEETEQLITTDAGEACYVIIKVFTCIEIDWDRVWNMLVTVLTIIPTIYTLYNVCAVPWRGIS